MSQKQVDEQIAIAKAYKTILAQTVEPAHYAEVQAAVRIAAGHMAVEWYRMDRMSAKGAGDDNES